MDQVRESMGPAGLAVLTYLVSPRPIRDPVTKKTGVGASKIRNILLEF